MLRAKDFAYDWSLKINAGISKAMLTRWDKGPLIWNKDPMLTVFIAPGGIDLDKIRVPEGISVLELSDLRRRYTQAIRESEEISVRGWGACSLARLDPSNLDTVSNVVALLHDTNDWVRLNAVAAIASSGAKAASAIPVLKQARETSDKSLKGAIDQTLNSLQTAKEDPEADAARVKILESIRHFRKSLSK